MLTKSKAAFLLTAERLFTKKDKVYFWTFTFYTIKSDWEGSHLFSKFLHHLRNTLGGDWGGVRVVELHREHGVHYHALINRRLAVDIVRRIAKCYAIGRIFVEKADLDSTTYLSKYLTKQRQGPKTKSGRNARRWAAFGPIDKTRISDLINDSPMWQFRREAHLPFTSYRYEHLLSRAWDFGPQHFKAAWWAAKQDREGDLIALANGTVRVDSTGILAERAPKTSSLSQIYGPY